jgi:hypothetical protein
LLLAFLFAPCTAETSLSNPTRNGLDIASPNLRLEKFGTAMAVYWKGRHALADTWAVHQFAILPAAREALLALGLIGVTQIILLSCRLRTVPDLLRWRAAMLFALCALLAAFDIWQLLGSARPPFGEVIQLRLGIFLYPMIFLMASATTAIGIKLYSRDHVSKPVEFVPRKVHSDYSIPRPESDFSA